MLITYKKLSLNKKSNYYYILCYFPIQFCVSLCIGYTGKRSGISVKGLRKFLSSEALCCLWFEAICDFMARDQFLESCSRELYVHLKPKTFKNLDEMAKEADLFAEARGGVHTCTNKGQRDNRGAAQNHSKPDVNKGGGKQEIKCGICGKGHLTIKCYKNPNRMQANSAEVGNEAK